MIDARNAMLTRAIADGDADAVAAMHTEHAIVLPPVPPGEGSTWLGRDVIRSMWKMNFGAGPAALRWLDLQTEDVHVVTDGIVQETGRYRIGPAPGSPMDMGSYAVTWKRVDGEWLIDRNVIVSARQ